MKKEEGRRKRKKYHINMFSLLSSIEISATKLRTRTSLFRFVVRTPQVE